MPEDQVFIADQSILKRLEERAEREREKAEQADATSVSESGIVSPAGNLWLYGELEISPTPINLRVGR
jgi:hypothetical protein